MTKDIGVTKISGSQARELKRYIGLAQDVYACDAAEALLRALEDWAAPHAQPEPEDSPE